MEEKESRFERILNKIVLFLNQDNINSFQRKHQEGSDGRKKEYIPRGQPVFRHFLNNLLWRLFPPLTAFYQCRP